MDGEAPDDQRKFNKLQIEIENDSVISLGRRSSSSCESQPSSQKNCKSNLVQMKSIKGVDSDDDIYEYYLIDQGKNIIVRSSIGSRAGSEANESQIQIEQPIRRRLSSATKLLSHDCQCDDANCLMFHCPCYNEPNQLCSVDGCCPNCISMKTQLMQSNKEKHNLPMENGTIQKNHHSKCLCQKNGSKLVVQCTCKTIAKQKQPTPNDYRKSKTAKLTNSSKNNKTLNVANCSCKKSHCLKKYCACYALGKKCSSGCECDGCQNHPETGDDMDQNMQQDPYQMEGQKKNDEMGELDIDQFLQEKNYENLMMPVSMQFEYPDLRNSYHL